MNNSLPFSIEQNMSYADALLRLSHEYICQQLLSETDL